MSPEFDSDRLKHLGVKDAKELQDVVKDVIEKPTESKELKDGRKAYWDEERKVVVIHNPSAPGKGTVFKPKNGKDYYDFELK